MNNREYLLRLRRTAVLGGTVLAIAAEATFAADIEWDISSCGTNAISAQHCWVGGAVPDTGDNVVLDSPDALFRSLRFNASTLGTWNLLTGNSLTEITHNRFDVVNGDWQLRAAPGDGPYGYHLLDEITINGGTLVVGDVAGSPLDVVTDSNLRVGRNTTGSFTLQGGSTLSTTQGLIGELGGGVGTMVVTGPGTSWTSSSAIDVARLGTGVLTVENGASVTSVSANIGRQFLSSGTATISDEGSSWTVSSLLNIGWESTGVLSLESGGDLTTTNANIARSFGSNGSVTVGNGIGSSTWLNSGNLNVGGDDGSAGGTAALTINDGGNVDVGGTFRVWNADTVTLSGGSLTATTIENSGVMVANGGATVTSTDAIIGNQAGVTGNASVDGAGTTWTSTGTLDVGESGVGTLDITSGAHAGFDFARIGTNAGADGVVTVTGPGSTFDANPGAILGGEILIGVEGNGTLNIADGGHVDVGSGKIGFSLPAGPMGNGAVVVQGAGSTWQTGSLQVGALSTTGSLSVLDGGLVSTTGTGGVGWGLGATGTVTVDGSGSAWNNSFDTTIGAFTDTQGTLIVTGGGTVTNANGLVASTDNAVGNVSISDVGSTWTNTGDLTIGNAAPTPGGAGQVDVLDDGALIVGGTLSILNNGTLDIDGGSVSTHSFNGDNGSFDFEQGSLLIDGGTYSNNSSLLPFRCFNCFAVLERTLTFDNGASANTDRIFLGNDGASLRDGTVNVLGGSTLTSDGLSLGVDSAVFIAGAGSSWTHTDEVRVGGSIGSGATAVLGVGTGGALVTSSDLIVTTNGLVELSGGSVTADTVQLMTEVRGFGSLTGIVQGEDHSLIHAQGGTLTLGDASRLQSFNTTGAVVVDAGATLHIETLANFNRLGPLTQLNGGSITSNTGVTLEPGRVVSGFGGLDARVAAAVGSSILAEGNLSLGDAGAFDGYFSDGLLSVADNQVTINDRDEAVLGSFTELGSSNGGGTLIAANGFLLEFGKTISGYGTVDGDFLNNGLAHGEGELPFDRLTFLGDVSGVGDFSGNIEFAGSFSPGLSPTISNFNNANGFFTSETNLEIGGLTPGSSGHDQIIVTGDGASTGFAILDGVLNIDLINGWIPNLGDAYVLLIAEEILFQNPANEFGFATVNFPELTDGLQFALEFLFNPEGADTLTLNVTTAVPLPGAFWLLAPAMGFLLRRKRG